MTEYWDNSPEVDEERSDFGSSGTYLVVNGSRINVEPGSSFKDTVREQAANTGLGKFRVLFNGDEVKPSQAPETISENDKIELRPFDVAG